MTTLLLWLFLVLVLRVACLSLGCLESQLTQTVMQLQENFSTTASYNLSKFTRRPLNCCWLSSLNHSSHSWKLTNLISHWKILNRNLKSNKRTRCRWFRLNMQSVLRKFPGNTFFLPSLLARVHWFATPIDHTASIYDRNNLVFHLHKMM